MQDYPPIILKTSEDGSSTLYRPDLNEHYHSIHGAIQESMHVFIWAGLMFYFEKNPELESEHFNTPSQLMTKNSSFDPIINAKNYHSKPIQILEVGFGTGLNALLTLTYSQNHSIYYHSLEKFPLSKEIIEKINYPQQIPHSKASNWFNEIHNAQWDQPIQITPQFQLFKEHTDLQKFKSTHKFDLVYFDAFAPDKQPDLWTPEIFENIANIMNSGAILTTYSAKGIVRRAMQKAGLKTEKIPGPPGKREMLRAIKK